MIVALLVACAGGAPDFADCADAPCRAQAALRDWATDPDGTAARVGALPDEVERLYVVEKLVEAHPGETASLCAHLPVGQARRRCELLNQRPHLQRKAETRAADAAAAPAVPRTAPGPASARLDSKPFPLGEGQVPEGVCEAEAGRGSCLEAKAEDLAKIGELAAVPLVCARESSADLVDECVFRAAEAAAKGKGAEGYARGAALCSAAGAFVTQCHEHLLLYALPEPPPADAMTEVDVREAIGFAAAIRAAWAPVDPAIGEVHAGWFWSRWLLAAWAGAGTVTGTPLQWLPPEALPYARAAVATRLQNDGALAGTLDARVATLATTLDRRPPPVATTRHTQADMPGGASRWPADLTPEQAATPAAWYSGNDRRPVDPDPAVDLALAVVAAAAHASPLDEPLIDEARSSGTPVVAAYATWAAPKKKAPPKKP